MTVCNYLAELQQRLGWAVAFCSDRARALGQTAHSHFSPKKIPWSLSVCNRSVSLSTVSSKRALGRPHTKNFGSHNSPLGPYCNPGLRIFSPLSALNTSSNYLNLMSLACNTLTIKNKKIIQGNDRTQMKHTIQRSLKTTITFIIQKLQQKAAHKVSSDTQLFQTPALILTIGTKGFTPRCTEIPKITIKPEATELHQCKTPTN